LSIGKYKFVKPVKKYIRVGTDYFKIIEKKDRYNIERIELKRWTKEEIKQDHGVRLLDDIDKL
jgi:hypothetical protein